VCVCVCVCVCVSVLRNTSLMIPCLLRTDTLLVEDLASFQGLLPELPVFLSLHTHACIALPVPGPALCCINNAPFTEKDKENIRHFASEPKREDLLAIGRFGIGFATCYSYSDLPQILSNKELMIFDPSKIVFKKSNGKRFEVDKIRARGRQDTLKPFGDYVDQVGWTVVRLPLRRLEHAQVCCRQRTREHQRER
jgi:hypothetical protein